MEKLASAIRNRRDDLAAEYAGRLRLLKGYAELPESTLLDVARCDLDLLAACLEAQEAAPFISFTETRLGERVASGFEFGTLQDALTALEETILPLASDLESAKFMWRTMSQTRAIVSRIAEEKAREAERQRLGMLTDIAERQQLEQQIQESLERRGQEVQISTQVAQEIAAAPALDELFRRVVTLIKERFGYYHAQIFRYESALNAVVLVTGYGEAGQRMLAAGHRLEMGRGVVGAAAVTGRPVLATDVMQDKDWRPNPNLPGTKGELAVPIKLRAQVLGILDVQSDRAGALTTEDQLLLEGLCGQIAIAIEDTRLRQEMEERLNEISAMYRAMSREGWQAFRETGQLPGGYLFEHGTLEPKPDLWLPEIEQAVKQNTLAQSAQPDSAVVSPLSARGEIIGALGVIGDPHQHLSPDDMELITSVSEQVSLALESARLFEQTQAARQQAESRVREMEILNRFTREVSSTLDLNHVLDALVNTLEQDMDFNYVSLDLIDEPANAVRTVCAAGLASGMNGLVRPLDQLQNDITIDVARKGQIEIIDGWDDRFDRELFEREGHAKLVRAFVPLLLREKAIGTLEVGYRRAERPAIAQEEVNLLRGLASQVAIAIQNTRLFEQTQAARQQAESRVREMQILNEIARQVTSTLDLDRVLDALVAALQDQMHFGFVQFSVIDEPANAVRTLRATGLAEGMLGAVRRLDKMQNDIVMDVARKGQIEVIDGWDDRFDREIFEREGHAALVRAFVPLRLRGQTIALLEAGYRRDERAVITPDEVQLLASIADQVAVAIQNTRLYEQTQARARREQILREVTAHVRSSTDPDTVMRTLARELGTVLGRPTFVRLVSSEGGDSGQVAQPAGGNPHGDRPTSEGGK